METHVDNFVENGNNNLKEQKTQNMSLWISVDHFSS